MAAKHGTFFNDTIHADSGLGDQLYGYEGDDVLHGYMGRDRLDGGSGADTMRGYGDADTYIVDNAGDVVIEDTYDDQNGDTVISSISYTLPAFVEHLTLYDGARNGTGNEFDNLIRGNSENNILLGLGGDDIIRGFAGRDTLDGSSGIDTLYGGDDDDRLRGGDDDDTLYGEAGNDVLDGGRDADTMAGGLGDDTYFVDDERDEVIEASNQGRHDTVFSALESYTLTANVEDMVIEGVRAFHGTGNALDNQIVGNANANTLKGQDGNDTLYGMEGDDTLIGGTGGTDHLHGGRGNDSYLIRDNLDVVHEKPGEGIDSVTATVSYSLTDNIENLTLVLGSTANGNALNNIITGNMGDNTINGGDGDDTIAGGREYDIERLTGGAGRDTFVYNSRSDSNTTATSTGDFILDFNTAEDLIDLRALGVNAGDLVITNTVGLDGRRFARVFEDLNHNGVADGTELSINIIRLDTGLVTQADVLL